MQRGSFLEEFQVDKKLYLEYYVFVQLGLVVHKKHKKENYEENF